MQGNLKAEISFADINDIEKIYDIEKNCFADDSWTLKMLKEACVSKYSRILKACSENGICGFLVYTVLGGDEINIDDIAVTPEMRGCGFAYGMIDFLFKIAVKENIRKITLEVREKNKAAIKLYEKFGFRMTAVRKNYYRNPVENAVLMDAETL